MNSGCVGHVINRDPAHAHAHKRQLKRRENAILTAERTSSFVPHRVTMADKKERRGKAFLHR